MRKSKYMEMFRSTAMVAAMAVVATLAVRGEQVATLDTVGNIETLYTASYWSNNISPTNEQAAGWVYQAAKAGIRLPENKTLSFKCQKMIFGTSGTRCDFYGKPCNITFENEGLHLVYARKMVTITLCTRQQKRH